MALVDYSDSEESQNEGPRHDAAPATNTITKPSFQKRVDKSNPRRIQVSLPQHVSSASDEGQRASKRLKTEGGGTFGDFASFLPAPKNTKSTTSDATSNTKLGSRGRGLGAGVNLKTGSAPGFSREVYAGAAQDDDDFVDETPSEAYQAKGSILSLPPPKALEQPKQQASASSGSTGSATMFKPLSVARKATKRKSQISYPVLQANATASPVTPAQASKPKKISLFSIENESTDALTSQTVSANQSPYEHPNDLLEPTYENYTPDIAHTMPPPAVPTPPAMLQNSSQTLKDVADDLSLTPSERRRLFGRQGSSKTSGNQPKIVNYSTETEYSHNELVRQAAEGQPVHNPVRSLAPGKHSLKQLVGAVQNQKDALEESFIAGKGRRKEAGSRYGW